MAGSAMPGPKEQFLDAFRRERETTLKVMRAFPADKKDFKPHERSSSALGLIWTFAIEQGVTVAALNGTLKLTGQFPPPPPTISDAIAAYEQGTKDVEKAVGIVPESRLFENTTFFTGPKQMGDVQVMGLMWFMLMDSIHHRGQLSVYVRMAGGQVPSIYGPSADEPWN